VELLLRKGADVDARDKDGDTALTMAEKKKHSEIVKILKKYGAKG
jgi:ankyrin repeat protein